MNKTVINWGYGPKFYTWNPITGCKRGCEWCYAKRIHDRFHPDVPFSEIQVHPSRFDDPDLWKKAPCVIFVGSMSDPDYWPPDEFERVLDVCRTHHKNMYMFLSKNPRSYWAYNFPKNTMQGITMTCAQTQDRQREIIAQAIKCPRPFLSIEPLLGCLQVKIPDNFERIIVGAMTGPRSVEPRPEWIKSLYFETDPTKVFWKDSAKKYL